MMRSSIKLSLITIMSPLWVIFLFLKLCFCRSHFFIFGTLSYGTLEIAVFGIFEIFKSCLIGLLFYGIYWVLALTEIWIVTARSRSFIVVPLSIFWISVWFLIGKWIFLISIFGRSSDLFLRSRALSWFWGISVIFWFWLKSFLFFMQLFRLISRALPSTSFFWIFNFGDQIFRFFQNFLILVFSQFFQFLSFFAFLSRKCLNFV